MIKFYFPLTDDFLHTPSNISESGLITARAHTSTLKVRRKRIITKALTFNDVMLTTQGTEAKKDKIIDLLRTKQNLMRDKKFGFRFEDVCYFG